MELDGKGGERVVAELSGPAIHLRRVEASDCSQIWEWANDPEVRHASFAPQPIPWEAHTQSFRGKLEDPACTYFVGLDESDRSVGQVRFDTEGCDAVISISLDRTFRGRGFGTALIRAACDRVFAETGISTIRAYTQPLNSASIRAFERAGFANHGRTERLTGPAVELILRRHG